MKRRYDVVTRKAHKYNDLDSLPLQYTNGRLESVKQYLVATKQYVQALGKLLTVGTPCEVVGSGCESGLPRLSPHSSTYSYLTLHAPIGQLQSAWEHAQQIQRTQQGEGDA